MKMNNHPIAFFYCGSNDMFNAIYQRDTCLLPSQFSKGAFPLIDDEENVRRSMVLFCCRSVPKHTWINDNNRFIGKE